MALSNAERQRRYKERLKAQANGVTPEMVYEAARIFYVRYKEYTQDENMPSWDEHLRNCRKPKARGNWVEFIPDDIEPDAWDDMNMSEDERALLTKVAAVAHAIKNPPPD
jgi:hypothetical protein